MCPTDVTKRGRGDPVGAAKTNDKTNETNKQRKEKGTVAFQTEILRLFCISEAKAPVLEQTGTLHTLSTVQSCTHHEGFLLPIIR